MTLQPAYGRDYKSRAAVLADLKAGKDFLFNGKPINLPQWLNLAQESIEVRYGALRKVAVFKRSELE